MKDLFKDIIYFPSFSVGLGPYMARQDMLAPDLSYRFYDDTFEERFRYKKFLITAGHYYKKDTYRKDMGLDNGSLVIGDSGGFQIASGAIKYSDDIVAKIFNWLENNSDIAVNLDIPPRMTMNGKFNECLELSIKNFKYFEKHQTGKTNFVNVVHGYNEPEQYKIWYDKVKHFDFQGWCIGSGGGSLERSMYAFALLLQEGEFDRKQTKVLHFLGQTTIFDFMLYNFMQRMLDTNGMDHVQVTTDSSTPVMYTLYGNVIHSANYAKLSYKLFYINAKIKPDANYKIPCPADCPVCQRFGFDNFKEYNTHTRHLLAYHNFYMFLHILKEVKQLCSTHMEFLSTFVSPEVFKVLSSIIQMGQQKDKALDVFRKHQPLYQKLSELATINIINDKAIDDQFE